MTRIYCDLEFVATARRIRPLSIAMVDEDGGEFYRVFRDDGAVHKAMGDPWLRENVLPWLPVEPLGHKNDWRWDGAHMDTPLVRPREVIAGETADFVLGHPEPQLWGDYCAFDYVAVAQMFGDMTQLPPGFPMFMSDLRTEWQRLGRPGEPRQSYGLHHALHDARHGRALGEWLGLVATSGQHRA